MGVLSFALLVALGTVLIAEFVNGWTDAPNVIATVVSTGALSSRAAIVMAVMFNVLGAMGGTAVAATVGRGIVAPSAMTLPAIIATMLSIITWGSVAAAVGIPVSKSHALLAGLVCTHLRCQMGCPETDCSGLGPNLSILHATGFCGRPDREPALQLKKSNRLVLSRKHLHKSQMELAQQVAALPVRREADGSIRVLLITSRETGRWVIPKGWPWPDCEDCVAAAQEAREEAGVVGRVQSQPLGSFVYQKQRPSGPELVRADVYLIEVASLLDSWPEQGERQRAWFTLEDAAKVVSDHELRDLLQTIGDQ